MLAEIRRGLGSSVGLTVVALTALGAGLRFATLGDQTLWYDEYLSSTVASGPLSEVMPHCVLAHIDIQDEVEKLHPGSTALWFQSLGGTSTTAFNTVTFTPVTTAKLRATVRANGNGTTFSAVAITSLITTPAKVRPREGVTQPRCRASPRAIGKSPPRTRLCRPDWSILAAEAAGEK